MAGRDAVLTCNKSACGNPRVLEPIAGGSVTGLAAAGGYAFFTTSKGTGERCAALGCSGVTSIATGESAPRGVAAPAAHGEAQRMIRPAGAPPSLVAAPPSVQ